MNKLCSIFKKQTRQVAPGTETCLLHMLCPSSRTPSAGCWNSFGSKSTIWKSWNTSEILRKHVGGHGFLILSKQTSCIWISNDFSQLHWITKKYANNNNNTCKPSHAVTCSWLKRVKRNYAQLNPLIRNYQYPETGVRKQWTPLYQHLG